MTVRPKVHLRVLQRDGGCFVARTDPTHVCRDQWGITHLPDDARVLTVDHVKPFLMMGRKFSDDIEFMVAMCHAANVGVPNKVVREQEREYLSVLYPEAWASAAKVRAVFPRDDDPDADGLPEVEDHPDWRSPAWQAR